MVADVSARPRYALGPRVSRPSLTARLDTQSTASSGVQADQLNAAEAAQSSLPVPGTSTVPRILTGGLGNDTLVGAAGNDVLSGGAGADLLIGGAGSDAYIVDRADDQIVEQAQQGQDTVWAMVDWTLSAHLEDLVFLGAVGRTGHGNELANLMQGTGAADTLYGAAGDDALLGGAGADRLFGEAGHDLLQGGLGDDVLQGGAGQDRLIGGPGLDQFLFNRGDGADQIETEYAPDPDTAVLAQGDQLIFGQGIRHDQLWFSYREGDLWVRVLGGGDDSVQVLHWTVSNPQALKQVVAGDGYSLSAGRIGMLVQAMASTTAPLVGATTLTSEQSALLAASDAMWRL